MPQDDDRLPLPPLPRNHLRFWIRLGLTIGGALGLFAGIEYVWGAAPPQGAMPSPHSHVPRTPLKCGKMLVHAMWTAPGAVLQPAPPCLAFAPMVTIPPAFTVAQNPNPLVVDVLYRSRRLGSVVLPATLPEPPPSLTLVDKRPRPFATKRWTEAGVEFIAVVPGDLPPLTLKESRP